ncbi:hypothetical protein ACIQPR_48390 [Streptomyces sp. NPDC091280]|uniref:hypothetical protein n=1 Tax=Streptomyces sp. NPDC091280 TaxID=3365984 RepID=UPI0037F6CF29
MPLICENLNRRAAAPDTAAPPTTGAPVLLESEDLTILRLIAAGRRRTDISDVTFSSTTKIDTRRRRLCDVLAADNSEQLAALGTVYGLVTRAHLPAAPRTAPPVSEDDQKVLDLLVSGLNGSCIAARLQCDAADVHTAIAQLACAFRAANRRQLAAHAVVSEAVACNAVSPRFPPGPVSTLPPFRMTAAGTGILLHTTPPQPSRESQRRSPASSRPVAQVPSASGTVPGMQRNVLPVPPELTAWASGYIGHQQAWALPNDAAGARCWRMSSPEGIVELRVARTHGDLHREVSAHRHAISRLEAALTPRLLGFHPGLRALLVREPRGERVEDTPTRGLHLTEPVHEQAGQLLHTLHESTPGTGDRQALAAENTLRYIGYIDRILERIDSPWLPGQRAVVRHRLDGLRNVLAELPAAFCHGSFGPSAWRWQRPTRSLALTGFTRPHMMAAVVDLARPSLLWTQQPLLQDAFTRGYGRRLSDLENCVLDDFAFLASLEDLWHAIRLKDAEACRHLARAVRTAADRLPDQP